MRRLHSIAVYQQRKKGSPLDVGASRRRQELTLVYQRNGNARDGALFNYRLAEQGQCFMSRAARKPLQLQVPARCYMMGKLLDRDSIDHHMQGIAEPC